MSEEDHDDYAWPHDASAEVGCLECLLSVAMESPGNAQKLERIEKLADEWEKVGGERHLSFAQRLREVLEGKA